MASNYKNEPERVSTRVSECVSTPVGDVLVRYSGASAELVVSVTSDRPERIRFVTDTTDGLPELRVRIGKRPPHIGDEVTQNGRTFEVEGVRMTHGNKVQIHGDNGVWEDWKES